MNFAYHNSLNLSVFRIYHSLKALAEPITQVFDNLLHVISQTEEVVDS